MSIVDARRALGRLAEEVRRTRRPVVLTRRGRAVAHLAPEPAPAPAAPGRERDAFAALRGTLHLSCGFGALQQAVRELRSELARSLETRAKRVSAGGARRRD